MGPWHCSLARRAERRGRRSPRRRARAVGHAVGRSTSLRSFAPRTRAYAVSCVCGHAWSSTSASGRTRCRACGGRVYVPVASKGPVRRSTPPRVPSAPRRARPEPRRAVVPAPSPSDPGPPSSAADPFAGIVAELLGGGIATRRSTRAPPAPARPHDPTPAAAARAPVTAGTTDPSVVPASRCPTCATGYARCQLPGCPMPLRRLAAPTTGAILPRKRRSCPWCPPRRFVGCTHHGAGSWHPSGTPQHAVPSVPLPALFPASSCAPSPRPSPVLRPGPFRSGPSLAGPVVSGPRVSRFRPGSPAIPSLPAALLSFRWWASNQQARPVSVARSTPSVSSWVPGERCCIATHPDPTGSKAARAPSCPARSDWSKRSS